MYSQDLQDPEELWQKLDDYNLDQKNAISLKYFS